MKNKDQIELKGVFHVKIFQGDKLINEITENNLIVASGRTALAQLLGNTSPGGYISNIAFGEGSVAPSTLDTTLTTPFSKAVNSVSYPGVGQVKFDWSLELTEDNGVTIQEYGLMCSDGTLFARKTGVLVAKDNTIRLEGSWTIIY